MQQQHVWSQRLDLGDEQLDGAHPLQFSMLGALVEAIERRHPAMAGKLAEQLAGYTAAHFEGERLLMETTAYPLLPEHCEEHRALLGQLGEVRELLAGSEYDLALPMTLDLLAGLGSHIAASDRRFAEHSTALRRPR